MKGFSLPYGYLGYRMAEQFNLDLSGNRPKITPRKDGTHPRKKVNIVAFYMGSAGSIGFAILIPLLVGIGIGIWLDNKFLTKPQFTVGGLLVGLILSITNLIFTVKKIIKDSKSELI